MALDFIVERRERVLSASFLTRVQSLRSRIDAPRLYCGVERACFILASFLTRDQSLRSRI
jgi:hypothetical protein